MRGEGIAFLAEGGAEVGELGRSWARVVARSMYWWGAWAMRCRRLRVLSRWTPARAVGVGRRG